MENIYRYLVLSASNCLRIYTLVSITKLIALINKSCNILVNFMCILYEVKYSILFKTGNKNIYQKLSFNRSP